MKLRLWIGLFLIATYLNLWAATSSTNLSAFTRTANKILLIDSGYIETPTEGNAPGTKTFQTRRICPVGFSPYVSLAPSKVWTNRDYSQALTAIGVCVQQLTTTSLPTTVVYTVNYLISKRFVYLNLVFDYAFQEDELGETIYGSTSSVLYSPELIQYQRTTFNKDQTHDDVRGINWNLYCFPASQSPPIVQLSTPNPTCVPDEIPF